MKIKDELTLRELSCMIVAIDITSDYVARRAKRIAFRSQLVSFFLFWERHSRARRLNRYLAVTTEFMKDLQGAQTILMNAEGRDADMRPVTFRQMVSDITQE